MPMLYANKKSLISLFIVTLFLLPLTRAVSGDLSQQIKQLEFRMAETNQKVATLAANQHQTSTTISTLQTALDSVHHHLTRLKSVSNQPVLASAGIQRTANGHGR
jgi:hypothetical protein